MDPFSLSLDDDLIDQVGLSAMPSSLRREFLQFIYDQLELRVGEALSADMSDEQLDEFSNIVDGDEAVIVDWLDEHDPDYRESPLYTRLRQVGFEDSTRLRNEYTATRWLEVARPNFRDIVQEEFDKLKEEIRSSKDQILKQ